MFNLSKITIFSFFIIIIVGLCFTISSDVFANNASGSVYICPNATSSAEVNPRCPGKVILKLGETVNGITLVTTIYNGNEYYAVLGFTNGGGGVNLPPKADANGPYQGDAGLPIAFNAGNSSDPNNDALQYRWDFNNDESWDTDWLSVSTIEHIWNNDYEGTVKLEVSDGEFTATVTTSVMVKSPRAFKREAVSELDSARTGDKKNDQKIDKIIQYIQTSLNDDLWIDASHLIFFKKDCLDPQILKINPEEMNLEEMFNLDSDKAELKMKSAFQGKCFGPKIGIRVFHQEYLATKLMFKELGGKSKISEKLKDAFKEAISKLVKTDQLLAKIAIYDAKNTSIQNPKFQKIVKSQIKKAEEELLKAEKEISQNRPDKAIMRFSKAWLYAQLAIKFANYK